MMFRASAPGSLMVLGEYAVLYGKSALVGAIDRRMTVTLVERKDRIVHLVSSLGEYKTEVRHLQPVAPFQFVLSALKRFRHKLPQGFDLVIESGFSSTMGFASSAAVTVATLAAVRAFLQIPVSLTDEVREARQVIRAVQGGGSGADAAACVMGGLVAYRATPLSIEKLPCLFPLSVLYSGNKAPTPVVMEYVREKFAGRKEMFRHLMAAIGLLSNEGIIAARSNDLARLGEVMNMQQGLMVALGVGTDKLNHLVEELKNRPGMAGAKISGSGLGDCVIGLGERDRAEDAIAFSSEGVLCAEV